MYIVYYIIIVNNYKPFLSFQLDNPAGFSGSVGIGLYGFCFTPAFDAEYYPTAEAIADSAIVLEAAE